MIPACIPFADYFSRAFAAFPDSPQFEQGEQCHSFRVREQLPSEYGNRPPTKDGYIYGFSHFTQKRDESSKRGYRQVGALDPPDECILAETFSVLLSFSHNINILHSSRHLSTSWDHCFKNMARLC